MSKHNVCLGVTIFDSHAHFPYNSDEIWGDWARNYVERFGREKFELLNKRNQRAQEEWWRNWGFPIPDTNPLQLDELIVRWQRELDRYGIEGIVFLTGGGNNVLLEVVQYDRRFVGFAHHDPFSENAAVELERALDKGLRGFKIFAPSLRGYITDERLYPLWEICESREVPCLIHFGPLGGGGGITNHPNINPLSLHDVAKGFPKLNFIVPHFGCGYPNELLHLMWGCENVYVDTSGNNEWMRWMVPPLNLHQLFAQFKALVGPLRIIFGTDSSHFPRGWVVRYAEEQLRAAREVGYSQWEIEQVFRENMKRLLQL